MLYVAAHERVHAFDREDVLELVEYDDRHDPGLHERLDRQFEQGVKCRHGVGVARTLERDRDADGAERDAKPAGVQEPLAERAQLAVQLLRVGALYAVGDLGDADDAVEVTSTVGIPCLSASANTLRSRLVFP